MAKRNVQPIPLNNLNPYTQELILKLKAASLVDVDSAYSAAERSFATWSQMLPSERKSIILRKVWMWSKIDAKEIIDWLIRESGSTRFKANIEVDAVLGIINEAITFPERMEIQKLQSIDPTRKSHVVRKALGVIAVISPWNFPFHLGMRSLVTYLAIGNCIGVKACKSYTYYRRNATC